MLLILRIEAIVLNPKCPSLWQSYLLELLFTKQPLFQNFGPILVKNWLLLNVHSINKRPRRPFTNPNAAPWGQSLLLFGKSALVETWRAHSRKLHLRDPRVFAKHLCNLLGCFSVPHTGTFVKLIYLNRCHFPFVFLIISIILCHKAKTVPRIYRLSEHEVVVNIFEHLKLVWMVQPLIKFGFVVVRLNIWLRILLFQRRP